jgi:hypothetical protein
MRGSEVGRTARPVRVRAPAQVTATLARAPGIGGPCRDRVRRGTFWGAGRRLDDAKQAGQGWAGFRAIRSVEGRVFRGAPDLR